MKKLYGFLIAALVISISACSDDDANDVDPTSTDVVLLFGQFNGFCGGEGCIEIFKLEGTTLSEDTNDNYPTIDTAPYDGDFVALAPEKYDLVKTIINEIPEQLLDESNQVFGCPDCADQGGYYLEYIKDGVHQYWLFDADVANNPAQYHNLINEISAKVQLINS